MVCQRNRDAIAFGSDGGEAGSRISKTKQGEGKT
jgi:hypothetical protein